MMGTTEEKYVTPWAPRTWPVSVPTRALALRGAEILVIPPASTGDCGRLRGLSYGHAQSRIWRLASTQNMVEPGGRGLAFVAAPEELL
jgi:hypothetical protein